MIQNNYFSTILQQIAANAAQPTNDVKPAFHTLSREMKELKMRNLEERINIVKMRKSMMEVPDVGEEVEVGSEIFAIHEEPKSEDELSASPTSSDIKNTTDSEDVQSVGHHRRARARKLKY